LIPPSIAIASTSWAVSNETTPISNPSSEIIPVTASGDVSRRSSIASRPPIPPTSAPAIAPEAAPTSTHQATAAASWRTVAEPPVALGASTAFDVRW